MRCCRLIFALTASVGTLALALAAPPHSPLPTGNALAREARKILSENCFACHGPDAQQRKASLRLDEPNRAVIPGDIVASALTQRIGKAHDDALVMPPALSQKTLTTDQAQVLRRWVGEGARYPTHWAFVAPVRPPVPGSSPSPGSLPSPASYPSAPSSPLARKLAGRGSKPEFPINPSSPRGTRDSGEEGRRLSGGEMGRRGGEMGRRGGEMARRGGEMGRRGGEMARRGGEMARRGGEMARRGGEMAPIDAFIRAKLAQESIAPAPEADKRTLIRRVSLDLSGLPPTQQELAAFLADTSPNAYEKVVERLLASPHYGERMALGWLDLARYADTHGYHIDSHRDMYRWRDWVIQAFNSNKPYDQFVIEQLAGDLLPSATRDQKIATGFNRNHPINFEGGAIPEEYLVNYVVDRVDTTATAFLGLTLRCAQCHDHKYDPLTQRDYFKFFAYFNNNDEVGLDGTQGNARPFLKAPYPEQEQRAMALEAQKKELETTIAAKEASPVLIPVLLATDWDKLLSPGLVSHLGFRGPLTGVSVGKPTQSPGIVSGALSLDGASALDLKGIGAFEKDQAFSYGCWVWPEGGSQALFSRMDNAQAVRGWDLYLADGQPMAHFIHTWPSDALRADSKDRLPMGKWSHLFVTYDGSGTLAGVRMYLNGKPSALTAETNSLKGSITVDKPLRLGGRDQATGFRGKLDDIRLYNRVLPAAEVALLAETDPLRLVLAQAPDQRTPEQQKTLTRYALRAQDSEYRLALEQLRTVALEKETLEKEIPTTMVMQERSEQRPTFLLDRGQYDKPRERIEPGIPALFSPSLREGRGQGMGSRLEFARWIVSPTNPLTARVAVNRLWQQFFGVGLVKTSENFGLQGEAPSHPELLDWLAVEFRESGWDVKALVRKLVTSETYKQSSKATPELLKRDPENRLLAHAPRLRLPAELVRDQALAASGLLVRTIGGPSVKPYQPAGLWEEMSFKGSFSAQTYEQDHGDKLYRRSMYTFWKRTVPPPSLQTFDAPEREFCIVRRSATNTPLQALVLLNDPTYIEASRKLAERVMREAVPSASQRLSYLYRLVLARSPRSEEISLLMTVLNRQTSAFRKAPERAKQLLMVGEAPADKALDPIELAAWATVCSTVLNLDEAITRG